MKQNNTKKFFLSSALLLMVAVIPAKADFVQNGNFAGSPGGFTTVWAQPVSNPGQDIFAGSWQVITPSGNTNVGSIDWIGTYWNGPTPGTNSVDLDGSSAGGIQQTISGLTTNQTYTLSFEFSGNPQSSIDPSGNYPTKTLLVNVGNVTGQTYTITPNWGATSLNSMVWTAESFVFTAPGPTTVLQFVSADQQASYTGPVVTDVSISATPEPGFYGVLALGLAGLAFAMVRRRSGLKNF